MLALLSTPTIKLVFDCNSGQFLYNMIEMIGQRNICVSETAFRILQEGKRSFEEGLNVKISWSAFLSALCLGALSGSQLPQMRLLCPNCGGNMELKLIKPSQKKRLYPSRFSHPHQNQGLE